MQLTYVILTFIYHRHDIDTGKCKVCVTLTFIYQYDVTHVEQIAYFLRFDLIFAGLFLEVEDVKCEPQFPKFSRIWGVKHENGPIELSITCHVAPI